MFLTVFAVFAIAISLLQLGALSVWVAVLSFALNSVVLVVVSQAPLGIHAKRMTHAPISATDPTKHPRPVSEHQAAKNPT